MDNILKEMTTPRPAGAEGELAGEPDPIVWFNGEFTDGLPPEALHRAWMELAALRRNPNIALCMGKTPRLPDTISGMAMCSSSTVGEAVRNLTRYWELDSRLTRFTLEEAGELVWLRYSFLEPSMRSRYEVDYRLASVLSVLQYLTGRDLAPYRLHLQHDHPEQAHVYFRVFCAPVQFSCDHDALVLRQETLRVPALPMPRGVRERVLEYANEQFDRMTGSAAGVARVREVVRQAVHEGHAGVKVVAPRLRMSPRSLQRLLVDAGTSYRDLVAEVRLEMAREYLQHGDYSLAAVAAKLGYADPANFHRAFKRWTGETPARYRARMGGAQYKRG